MSPPNDPGMDIARQVDPALQAPEPPMPTDPAIAPAPGLASATTEPTPPPDPTASHALLGRLLGATRKTQVGRMVDRYQKPTVGTSVKRLHQDLKGLATEGEPGRFWYEKSSKRILDYVQGNKDEAHKIAQLIAIYSPQTGVPTNTANAIKSYNRAKSGQAMWAGDILERDKTFDTIKGASDHAQALEKQYGGDITKVPLDDSGKRFLFARHNMRGYENIATADRDLKAHLLMNEGIPFEGRKTNNFYRNLMVHIDPTIDQGSTQDLWMARAFGFHDDAVSNATKYDFMEKLTHKLGRELGWKPHQVQAAIWTAMKTRQEAVKDDVMKEALDKGMASMVPGKKGKPVFQLNEGQDDAYSSLMRDRALEKVLDADHIRRSARDFSDFLDANLAHVSWEATPSRSVDHLRGLSDLAPHKRADYHKRISEALQDQDGNDLLAQHLGLLSPGTVEAPGYWMGDVNPASHLQVATTRIKKAGQRPDIDDASKALLDHYANARGLLLKQDGVGYHRPFFNPQVSKANGIEFRFDKDLSADEIKQLGGHIDEIPDTAMIPSGPGKIRVIHLGSEDPRNPEGDRIPLDKHQPWHKAVYGALQKLDNGAITARDRLFASDGKLRGNDWKVNPNGEDYTRRLSAAGRSDVLRFVSDVLAPKVEAVDKAFAKEHGLARDDRLEKAIRASGSEEGVNLLHGLGARPQKAAGGAIDMGSTPYSTDAQGAPGGTAQRGKDALGLAGSGGGGEAPVPGSGRDFLNQLANDPKTDGMTRLFAAGMAKSGTFSGQDPSQPEPVAKADGGPVDDQVPQAPAPQQQVQPATPSYIKPVDEDRRQLSPAGLYSHAADEVWKQPQLKASPAQFKAMLTKRGVKPDEFKWSGYDQAFAGRDFVSKKEVRDHFVRNMPKIQETVKSVREGKREWDPDAEDEPKYHQYQLPGGKNYREVVLHMPPQVSTKLPAGYRVMPTHQVPPNHRTAWPYTVMGPVRGGGPGEGSFGNGQTPEAAIRAANKHLGEESGATYKSSHWDEPNPLLHLRMADREGPVKLKYAWRNKTSGNMTKTFDSADEAQQHLETLPEKLRGSLAMVTKPVAQKILHVEELQSDWGQAAREKGVGKAPPLSDEERTEYQMLEAMPDKVRSPEQAARREELIRKSDKFHKGEGVPPAPYIDSTAKWTDLGLKRVLHEAAKGGYDKVVVTPGEEQAKRFDLSRQISKIRWRHRPDDPDNSEYGGLTAYDHDGNVVVNKDGLHVSELSNHIGKEAAEKLVNAKPVSRSEHGREERVLEGLDLKVGGQGMKGYYDTIVPKALEKLARQHDPEARVQLHAKIQDAPTVHGTARIERQRPALTLHALTITPKMRASILAGQKGYAAGGRIGQRIHDDIYKKARKVVMAAGSYPGSSTP